MAAIGDIIGGVLKPVAGWLNKKTDRKINNDTIKGKLAQKKQGDETDVTLSDGEWETVGQAMQDKTWKDEYVTVSLVSIINMIVVGGIAAAFGYPQVLEGLSVAVTTLVTAGVDIGFLLTAVVLAAIGMKIWRM